MGPWVMLDHIMDGPMGHADTAVDCMMDGPKAKNQIGGSIQKFCKSCLRVQFGPVF